MNQKKIAIYDIKNKELSNKIENSNEGSKIYGFINKGNDSYLNASLQLLTRIKELKDGVFNYEKKYKINEDNDTEGKLLIEFKKMLNLIENSKNKNLIIDPSHLKKIMGKIDEKYYRNNQEDANEFISNFIGGLLMETSNKLSEKKIKSMKALKINNEFIRKAYDRFYNRFYIKKGYSFLMDIFYGIQQTQKYCKNCNEIISIKFNLYNMIELPIYQMAKQYKNKTLELNQILNEFKAEKKYEIKCNKCKKEINTKTLFYTFPKYLIIYFGRAVGDEYIYNKILYDHNLDIESDCDNKIYKYILECIIEHSRGANYGHYFTECLLDSRWYLFNDSFYQEYKNNYGSKSALILLYKSFK